MADDEGEKRKGRRREDICYQHAEWKEGVGVAVGGGTACRRGIGQQPSSPLHPPSHLHFSVQGMTPIAAAQALLGVLDLECWGGWPGVGKRPHSAVPSLADVPIDRGGLRSTRTGAGAQLEEVQQACVQAARDRGLSMPALPPPLLFYYCDRYGVRSTEHPPRYFSAARWAGSDLQTRAFPSLQSTLRCARRTCACFAENRAIERTEPEGPMQIN